MPQWKKIPKINSICKLNFFLHFTALCDMTGSAGAQNDDHNHYWIQVFSGIKILSCHNVNVFLTEIEFFTWWKIAPIIDFVCSSEDVSCNNNIHHRVELFSLQQFDKQIDLDILQDWHEANCRVTPRVFFPIMRRTFNVVYV